MFTKNNKKKQFLRKKKNFMKSLIDIENPGYSAQTLEKKRSYIDYRNARKKINRGSSSSIIDLNSTKKPERRQLFSPKT